MAGRLQELKIAFRKANGLQTCNCMVQILNVGGMDPKAGSGILKEVESDTEV